MSMLDDIDKFAKIWDSAQGKGIFEDTPKPKQEPEQEEDGWGSDFFGQNYSSDENMTINEDQIKYWKECSGISEITSKVLNENKNTSGDNKSVADELSGAHNPIYPNTIGKDQDVKVTQNWGVGGKEHFDLESLKLDLYNLESKLNALESEEKDSNSVQKRIDNIKKQIDELSDSLTGGRSNEKDND